MSGDDEFFKKWAQLLRKLRSVIAAVWFTAAVVGLFFAPKFLQATTSEYTSSVRTPATVAHEELAKYFPEVASTELEVTLFTSKEPNVVLTDGAIGDALNNVFREYSTTMKAKFKEVKSAFSYFTVMRDMNPPLPLLGNNFVNKDKTATFFAIGFDPKAFEESTELLDFAIYIENTIASLVSKYGLTDQVEVGTVGQATLLNDITVTSMEDMEKTEMIVFPIAMSILCYVIGNIPFMIYPLLVMPCVILVAFSTMYGVTKSIAVINFAPQVMMSLSIALGIDYCMFLLVRVQEGYKKYGDIDAAIVLMLKSAGHVIIVSGTTLICCFLGSMPLPVDALRTNALGCVVVAVLSMLVSLTLVPALLFMFGEKLLKTDAALKSFVYGKICGSQGQGLNRNAIAEEKSDDTIERLRENHDDDNGPANSRKGWMSLGEFLLNKRNGMAILVVLFSLIIPFIIKASQLKSYPDYHMDLPRQGGSFQTIESLGKDFSKAGMYIPCRFLFVAKEGKYPGGILQQAPWEAMQEFVSGTITEVPGTTYEDFEGPLVMSGQVITYAQVDTAIATAQPADPDVIALKYYLGTQVTTDRRALYVTVTTSFSPYTGRGFTWMKRVEDFYRNSPLSQDFDMYLEGVGPEFSDIIRVLYRWLPFVMAGTLVLVFVILGLFFRSLTAPLRSVVSMCYTLIYVYGIAVMTYQDGIFEKLNIYGLSPIGAIAWMAISGTFALQCGFSLDYDVFISQRCLEYRIEGYDHRSSILKGFVDTGRIITFAGVIMSIAFSGLIFSSLLTLSQYGFLLISALLIDTFVVRTFITPILLFLCGDSFAWWPRKDLPAPTKSFPPKEEGVGKQRELELVA